MHALLVDILRPLVRRYGVEAVRRALEEAHGPQHRRPQRPRPPKRAPSNEAFRRAAAWGRKYGDG